MDNNIYRIILLKGLNWKELIKLTECKKFYQIINCHSAWKSIFEKQFPEHIEMIQNKKWKEIKDTFKDLWVNGSYFHAPRIIYDDGDYVVEDMGFIVKQIFFDDITRLVFLHEKTKYKRTNEKFIAYLDYNIFIKKYPSIFYNNLRYNITIIPTYGGKIGEKNKIFVCSEIKLFENSVEI